MIIRNIPIRARKSANKWFWLNQNQYRDTNPKTIARAKKWFTEWFMTQNVNGEFSGPVHIHYEIYPKKNSDLMNIGSVLDKFFQDALVKRQIIKDDSCKYVKSVSFEFMGYNHPGYANVEITLL
jgi:hypothetical protein